MENSNEITTGKRERHWFVTLWIILIIVFSIISAIMLAIGTLFASVLAGGGLIAVVALSMIMSIAIVVFAFMLLKWKKIGFWGIVGATVLNVILNSIYFFSVNSLLTSLISIIVLYAVLQIKKGDTKAWAYLK